MESGDENDNIGNIFSNVSINAGAGNDSIDNRGSKVTLDGDPVNGFILNF